MPRFSRIVLIVIDACGVGEAPDAALFGDEGASTIAHAALALGGINMPVCQALGLGNIATISGVTPSSRPKAAWGKMREVSAGKDSTTGHWELMGCVLRSPLPTYPHGFPPDIIAEFERRTGRGTLGNKTASGTAIIEELGLEHLLTGNLIVYTSADSVFQIAAHEEIVSVEQLYEYCHIARELLSGAHAVGRVIARPFAGAAGSFKRTERRKDFSAEPPQATALDILSAAGRKTLAIGKVHDLFAGRGIAESVKTRDNSDGVRAIGRACQEAKADLIFANLVDFDQEWGHRRDAIRFARGLEAFDTALGAAILPCLREDDLLIITADHGCDPTFTRHTDHTREYVPILVFSPSCAGNVNLGVRESFADIGATALENFGVRGAFAGKSFLNEL